MGFLPSRRQKLVVTHISHFVNHAQSKVNVLRWPESLITIFCDIFEVLSFLSSLKNYLSFTSPPVCQFTNRVGSPAETQSCSAHYRFIQLICLAQADNMAIWRMRFELTTLFFMYISMRTNAYCLINLKGSVWFHSARNYGHWHKKDKVESVFYLEYTCSLSSNSWHGRLARRANTVC